MQAGTYSITTFIRTGALGCLRIGDDQAEVHPTLGSPDDLAPNTGSVGLERFGKGRVEVASHLGRIAIISLFPCRGIDRVGDIKILNDLPVRVRRSAAQMQRWLKSQGIEHEMVIDDSFQTSMKTSSRVTITFVGEQLESIEAS